MLLSSISYGKFLAPHRIFHATACVPPSPSAVIHKLRGIASHTPLRLVVYSDSRRCTDPAMVTPLFSSSSSATAGDVSEPKARITHVIFDMDGLLLDTETFYTLVQEKILARFGKTFDWTLKAKMMGKKAIESAHIFVEESGLTGVMTPEEFLEEREAMLQELFPTCKLMPGVKRLVQHLHANGIPICVATGSHKHHFELKTKNHGEIFSMMHHVVTSDLPEVKKGKPSPDVFLAAAKRFEGPVEPSNILVFEDAPSGVAAAKNAGMYAVMVPDPRLDASYLKEADQVISSLLDFNPNYWGLPPFRDEN